MAQEDLKQAEKCSIKAVDILESMKEENKHTTHAKDLILHLYTLSCILKRCDKAKDMKKALERALYITDTEYKDSKNDQTAEILNKLAEYNMMI
jgi:hypothetical protein